MTGYSLNPSRRPRRLGLSHRGIASLAVVSLVFALASCGTSDAETDEGASPSVTTITITSTAGETTTETSTTEDSDALSLDLYRRVIESPESFPVKGDADFVARGNYSYALIEATGDDHPELLLMVHARESSPISVFTIEDESLVHADGVLIDGALGGGGLRLRVKGSISGSGLYQIDHHSLSEDGQSTLFDFTDGQLLRVEEPSFFKLASPPSDHHDIEWFDTEEPSGLDEWEGAGTSSSSNAEPVESTAASESEDWGTYQFTGVVEKETALELMDGGGMPNSESLDEEHLVMVLDSPMNITAQTVGPHTRSAFIGEVNLPGFFLQDESYDWSQHIGERITISAEPEHIRFPTDASLPLGMLRVFDFNYIK
ncbi:MAG: hypothetical protein ACTIA3_12425 [Corynebacterium casei]|uniref:hypothetical protein n=1 Tax=Corynebacterium casei TaxID=160386 RepID=UPI0009CBDA79|nr:hypothetical protein [Corynebacterium casei]SLM92816.1 hypothetical protein CZ765_10655 [Corynebacterium casei]